MDIFGKEPAATRGIFGGIPSVSDYAAVPDLKKKNVFFWRKTYPSSALIFLLTDGCFVLGIRQNN